MINKLEMEILLESSDVGQVPEYQTEHSAGMDLHSTTEIMVMPLQRVLVDTGIKIAIPEGHEAQVRPRSGMSWKHGLTVLNSPGTIDSDYRGPVKVMLINLGDTSYDIKIGERIAQLVVAPYSRVEWKVVKELSETERGSGGMGSTGK